VQQVFTTEKIAKIVGLKEWRVVRFAQDPKFGITPAFGAAAGPGSRRLYDLENVCQMALASWLLQAGLRVEVIGRVLKQVGKQGDLKHRLKQPAEKARDAYLGVIRRPKGKIAEQEAAFIHSWGHLQSIFERNWDTSVLVVPIGLRFIVLGNVLDRLTAMDQEKEGV
jgi:DNA-binding transcriptional MerR regulator